MATRYDHSVKRSIDDDAEYSLRESKAFAAWADQCRLREEQLRQSDLWPLWCAIVNWEPNNAPISTARRKLYERAERIVRGFENWPRGLIWWRNETERAAYAGEGERAVWLDQDHWCEAKRQHHDKHPGKPYSAPERKQSVWAIGASSPALGGFY